MSTKTYKLYYPYKSDDKPDKKYFVIVEGERPDTFKKIYFGSSAYEHFTYTPDYKDLAHLDWKRRQNYEDRHHPNEVCMYVCMYVLYEEKKCRCCRYNAIMYVCMYVCMHYMKRSSVGAGDIMRLCIMPRLRDVLGMHACIYVCMYVCMYVLYEEKKCRCCRYNANCMYVCILMYHASSGCMCEVCMYVCMYAQMYT
jgi:hypothetical protein